MKLSEIKGEKALDMFAELIEPAAKIISDKEISEVLKDGKTAKAVKLAIKNHKESVIFMLATLDEKSVEDYECNLLSLPMRLLDIINDPYIKELFTSQSQEAQTSSGSATENIEESES